MPLEKSLKQYKVGFVIVDALAIALALVMAHLLREAKFPPAPYIIAIPYTVTLFLLAFRSFGAYETRAGGFQEILRVVAGVAAGMAALLALGFFYRGFSYSRLVAIYLALLSIILVVIGRHLYRLTLDSLFGKSQWLKRVILVGDGPHVDRMLEELVHSKSDYAPLGVVSARPAGSPEARTPHAVPVLGTVREIDRIIEANQPHLVIIADSSIPEEEQRKVMEAAIERNIHWMQVPHVVAPPDQDLQLTILAGVPLLGSKSNNITGFNYFLKRLVDIIVSSFLLILFLPLMVVVSLLIKLFSRGPVLFVQERIGYRGRPFKFYKFRSMHVDNDESIHKEYVKKWINGDEEAALEDDGVRVHKITRDPRVIPWIGPFIRKFSIDELPQLFNVLKGDMSLVGPRPCLPYEVDLYKRWHKMRFDVLPGITGLWQVSGRNRLTFDEMVSLDVRYLQNWSLALDLTIILKTPFVVLFDKAY